jgi:hypothetical protein
MIYKEAGADITLTNMIPIVASLVSLVQISLSL